MSACDPSRRGVRMPGTLLLVLLLGTASQQNTLAGPAGPPAVPGEMVSLGSAPYTQTWSQMLAQDARRRAQGGAFPQPGPLLESLPRDEPLALETPDDGAAPFYQAPPEPGGVAPPSPQTLGTGFAGISLPDEVSAFGITVDPPNTQGAIGPNHFVEMTDGSVAIYNRTGTRLGHVTGTNFFTVGIYPRNGGFLPRVLYDRRSSRWFAAALEFGSPPFQGNGIVLAVSRTDNPLGAWDKYFLDVGVPTAGVTSALTDAPTLGTDDNGVYLGMTIFQRNPTTNYAKLVATGKASLLAGAPTLGPVYQQSNITDMFWIPQPAHNHSPVGETDPAFFVSSSRTVTANVHYRTVTWSGGVASFSAGSTVATPAFGNTVNAPASGSTTNIKVGDSRLAQAVLRSNRLWTCRTVGVNSTGGASSADRTGCEWLELRVTGATLSLAQSGRVYDPGADPRFYYYPSIMVNNVGDAAMGFSGSRSTEFVGAYTCGRSWTDPAGTMQAVTQLKAGEASYTRLNGGNAWGNYSSTSLDPVNEFDFWTVQEYARSPANNWGTWISQLVSPPYVLTPSRTSLTTGGLLSVLWTAPAGSAVKDWIGLFKVGDPNTSYGWWKYTGGAISGTFFVVTPSQPGSYEFRYLTNDSLTSVRTSATVVVSTPPLGNSPDYTLTPGALRVAGEPLSISWTAPEGRPGKDWIGLFPVGAPNSGFIAWQYTGGASAGSFTGTAPAAGAYEFRYLLQGTSIDVERAAVTITAPSGAGYTLTPAATTVAPGGTVNIAWTAPAGTFGTDWIGLFKVSEPNTSFRWWRYTRGATSGTLPAIVPTEPGTYQFRYLLNNGYTDVERSVNITVQ